MKIAGFLKKDFSSFTGAFELMINPASLKLTKGISYAENKTIGSSNSGNKYAGHKPSTLKFETILDATGVVSDVTVSIVEKINLIDAVVYKMDGSSQERHYLVVSWGSFIFKGQLMSLDYDYTLFRSDGSPLRVKISFSLEGFMNKLIEAKEAARQSPDLSRLIVLKSGESIASWCNEIYGDPSYCVDVARYNGLVSFRNIQPGTEILFPSLNRND